MKIKRSILTILSGAISIASAAHFTFAADGDPAIPLIFDSGVFPMIGTENLAVGDEIGLFTTKGICAGGLIWNGSNKDVNFSAWSDNSMKNDTSGFFDGDSIFCKIYDASADIEYPAKIEYTDNPTGKFKSTDLYYTISSLKATLPLTDHDRDSLALVTIYDSCGGKNWSNDASNWRTSSPISTWQGVSCDATTGRVTMLNTHSIGLTGKLPSALGTLNNLTYMDVSGNQITAIPEELGNCSMLTDLYLYNNQISILPSSMNNLRNLKNLHVERNRISSFPPTIEGMTNLKQLWAINNQLTAFPNGLTELTAVTDIWIDSNKINLIPPSIGKMINLKNLTIRNNKIIALPEELGNLPVLNILYAEDNRIAKAPFTSKSLMNLTLQRNCLDFATLESFKKSISAGTFLYSPQDSVGTAKEWVKHSTPLQLDATIPGSKNNYTWRNSKDEVTATTAQFSVEKAGIYRCEIYNDSLKLSLFMRPQTIMISTGILNSEWQTTHALQVAPNPATTEDNLVRFTLPSTYSRLDLTVLSPLGTVLYQTSTYPGEPLTWNISDKNGRRVGSGTYLAVVGISYTDGTVVRSQIMVGVKDRAE